MRRTKRLIGCAAIAALTATVLGGWYPGAGASATSASGHAAAADPQVIDASKDPAAASQALNDFCQQLANCQFVNTSPITTSFGEPRVIGDALYNCGQAYAEDSVTISDERSESTSLEESLSAKVSLGFIGLESSSIEAEVNSKQLEEVSTTTTDENAVAVPPGWKGWTQVRLSTAYVTGTASVTDGIHLINITNFTLGYPGFVTPGEAGIRYVGVRTPMTDDDKNERCGSLPKLSGVGGHRLSIPGPATSSVAVCTTAKARTCRGRKLDRPVPVPKGRAVVTLHRGHRTHATGTVAKRKIVLDRRRAIRRGRYTLTISRPHQVTIMKVEIPAVATR
jgi:hypothetical protein